MLGLLISITAGVFIRTASSCVTLRRLWNAGTRGVACSCFDFFLTTKVTVG